MTTEEIQKKAEELYPKPTQSNNYSHTYTLDEVRLIQRDAFEKGVLFQRDNIESEKQ